MGVLGGFGGVGVGRRLLPESMLQGAPDGPCRLQFLGAQDRVFHAAKGSARAATLQESGLTTHYCAMSFGPSGINSPPEGGDRPPFAHPPVGCALRLRRPARRLGRLHGGGACRPRPPGLRPLWPPGHGPLLPANQRRGKRSAQAEGRRVSGLRGKFLKVGRADARRGSGGVPPGAVERWATRVRAVGGQGSTRSVVPAVHGPQRCPRRNGPQGTAVV